VVVIILLTYVGLNLAGCSSKKVGHSGQAGHLPPRSHAYLKLDQYSLPRMHKNSDLSLGEALINLPLLTSYMNIYANVNKTNAELLKEGFFFGTFAFAYFTAKNQH
jgi:hypothetical protein